MKPLRQFAAVLLACALGGPARPAAQVGAPSAARAAEARQHWRAASEHFNARRFREAAAQARRAREADASLLGAWKLEGLALQLTGEFGQAAQTFALALKQAPGDADLWFYLARVEYLQSSLKAAERSARRALELSAEHANAHAQLGMILEALLDYPNALAAYRRAIELNRRGRRETPLPLVYAGNLLAKLGRHAEALELFTAAARGG
jgi:tetratricopeptide (TPR) repeat protein